MAQTSSSGTPAGASAPSAAAPLAAAAAAFFWRSRTPPGGPECIGAGARAPRPELTQSSTRALALPSAGSVTRCACAYEEARNGLSESGMRSKNAPGSSAMCRRWRVVGAGPSPALTIREIWCDLGRMPGRCLNTFVEPCPSSTLTSSCTKSPATRPPPYASE
ncbi:uncharacterized protein LOC62_01G000974 [Vanrija pseudolonga]|uniref:Uncharacterized protein n=1 Tax=Vanrija pseudolonga TaxID=143232 RepID=A0AAF0Y609_9TREE|nr:hypothetical protein LOC62_01G000974 [Vanrija pseudolonga]